jgi:hypothetical protein
LVHSSPASTRSKKFGALRQRAGDDEGHGRIAVDTGGADAHALTDESKQAARVSLKVTGF